MEKANEIDLIENAPANEQIIKLRSVYKITKVRIYPVKSRSTGQYLGNVKRVDSMGDPILSREEKESGEWFPKSTDTMLLEEGLTFDLSNDRERKIWNWVKHHPKIANSWEEAQRSPNAEFYVYIPEKEAKKTISKATQRYTAAKYIMEDSNERHYNVAKLLRNNMDGQNHTEVLEYLLSVAESNPEKVINIYKDSNMKTKIFLLDALSKNVIDYSNGVYSYKTETLGLDESQAVEWLKDSSNKKIVDLISKEVYPSTTRSKTKTTK